MSLDQIEKVFVLLRFVFKQVFHLEPTYYLTENMVIMKLFLVGKVAKLICTSKFETSQHESCFNFELRF